MALACQKDSYLKELTTKVLSCTPVPDDKKPELVSCYEIVLQDTILFPGGGGQPDDRGSLNSIPVDSMEKKYGQVVHIVKSPIAVGEVAEVSVYWPRRFDHMQQHTGQHLITAIAEMVYGFYTTSWNLGADVCFIELNTPSISIYQIGQMEHMVNEAIRDCIPITIHYYNSGDPELSKVRASVELPQGREGPIRVVRIHGIDSNTCCGTHVKNTSELQAIKLLYAEKGKKNKTNLYFVVGERLIKYTRQCVTREKKLTELLGCCPDEHHIHVDQLQKSLKAANKNLQSTLRDVACLEAKLFNMQKPPPPYYSLHRNNAELEFMIIFLNEAASDETLFFLTVGDPRTSGHMMMSGPLPLVEKYGPQVCSVLDGKGAMNHGRYQGKVKKLSNIPEAEELLKKYVNPQTVSHQE